MPDKRKGWDHTEGRAFAGELVVPPMGMAEVTPTRVPGERQLLAKLGGWGPFLPHGWTTSRDRELVRPFAATHHVDRRHRGQRAPRLKNRLRAWATLTRRLRKWVQARERSLSSDEPPEQRAYNRMAQAHGFSIADRRGRWNRDGGALHLRAVCCPRGSTAWRSR